MTRKSASRLAWSIWALVMLGFLIFDLPLTILNRSTSTDSANLFFSLVGLGTVLTFPIMGALVASRRPENPIGWIFCAIGVFFVMINNPIGEYAVRGLITAPNSLPAAALSAWLNSWLAFIWFPAMIVPLFLLFPDGRPPSPRWWIVAWLGVAASLALSVNKMLTPGPLDAMVRAGMHYPLNNPTGLQNTALLRLLGLAAAVLVLTSLGASVAAIVVRMRRAKGDEREQLKWLVYVGSLLLVGVGMQGAFIAVYGATGAYMASIGITLSFLAWATLFGIGIPVAIGIAILKYRLYDIDVIISKTLLFGAMAAIITGVYVAIVVGIGALVGTAGKPNLPLSILATAVVAVAFQPVREYVQRLANRLVYGRRASPYEILSQFSDRVAGAYSSEEVLPRMARVLAEGTGAARADVWVRVGSELAPTASWPEKDGKRESLPLSGQRLPRLDGVARVVPVRHQGELLGALSIDKAAGEPLVPLEEKLLSDLAAQAGLVLRNVRLTAELQARLKEISEQAGELRASRQRIVAAQDAERRRLERNIHDGAQQNLVALSVKLRLASTFARRNPGRARELVRELEAETEQALETLRDLARGIYPPVLRDEGLAAALRAQAARIEIPVELVTDHLGRYSPDIEAAVYFCCLEALQNVAKHARASLVRVNLRETDGELTFSVSDNGVGFDAQPGSQGSGLQNMADRAAALGGSLDVSATQGRGTTVSGRMTVRAKEPIS